MATSAVVTGGAAAARTAAAAVVPAIAAAAVVGGALYAMGELAKATRLSAGEAANRVSREFASAQTTVMKQFRVTRWDQVPADVRNKLVNGYKKAIADVYAYRPIAGTIAPSKQIPYGR